MELPIPQDTRRSTPCARLNAPDTADRSRASSTRPSTSRTVRSACAAMPRSCVTMTIVRLFWAFKVRRIVRISSPVALSRLPVGSSANRTSGSMARARAMATRCISPPDSSRGLCFNRCPRPTISSSSLARGDVLCRVPQIARSTPCADHQRREHVFQRRQLGQQVIELEDHAELLVAQRVAPAARQVVDALAVEMDFAGVRPVERGQQVQQRALARPALTDDRQELAVAHLEVDAAQDRNLDLPFAIALFQFDRSQLQRPRGRAGRRQSESDPAACAGYAAQAGQRAWHDVGRHS